VVEIIKSKRYEMVECPDDYPSMTSMRQGELSLISAPYSAKT
jgi:hypothetical protein